MNWNVYLSGEIHTDWRQRIKDGCNAQNLSIIFTSAVTDHQDSDAQVIYLVQKKITFGVITNQQK